jgi:hypothetical protein
VLRWAPESLLDLPCTQIGEHYGRYRLHQPEAERAMARSLDRYGQLSPVVVCQREGHYELIDGFKRLGAARGLTTLSHLSARVMEADDRMAKAAIYGLNRAGGRTRELEEAWIVHALVREDGLSQVEVAELLGRHKSWVCRRLALLERLGPESREELRVGLLSPTAARQLVRLPQGNQTEVLEVIRREALSGTELIGVVDLLLQCSGRSQQEYILEKPREALAQWNASPGLCPAYVLLSFGDQGRGNAQDAITNGKLFLRRTKTGTDVFCPLPDEVLKALKAIGSKTEYYFWSGKSKPKSAVGDYQRALTSVFEDAKTPRVFPHLFRHTCITNWLSAGVPVETVAVLAGHSSIRVPMKHYSHWIKRRQDNLETEVKKSWAQLGTVAMQSD